KRRSSRDRGGMSLAGFGARLGNTISWKSRLGSIGGVHVPGIDHPAAMDRLRGELHWFRLAGPWCLPGLVDVSKQVADCRADIVGRQWGAQPLAKLSLPRDRLRSTARRALDRDRVIAHSADHRVGDVEELVEVISQCIRLERQRVVRGPAL